MQPWSDQNFCKVKMISCTDNFLLMVFLPKLVTEWLKPQKKSPAVSKNDIGTIDFAVPPYFWVTSAAWLMFTKLRERQSISPTGHFSPAWPHCKFQLIHFLSSTLNYSVLHNHSRWRRLCQSSSRGLSGWYQLPIWSINRLDFSRNPTELL